MKHLKKKTGPNLTCKKNKTPVALNGSKVQNSDKINGAPLETL